MATTEQIEQAATELGKLIGAHPHAQAMAAVQAELGQDADTMQLITDLNEHSQALAEKQQNQQPIEVNDKHKLDTLQQQMAANPLVGRLQMAQMDYVDLLRRVNEAIERATSGTARDTPTDGGD